MQKLELLPPMKGKVGDIIEISIPSNPSTGYSCLLSDMPDCVYFVESTYVPDQPIKPGSGGTSKFKFVGVKKGDGKIIFHSVKFSHPPEILEPTVMQKRFVIIE
ncbi:protease inhibitor I42 family protein [Methanosarcina sp. Z-7115]|uniref:Protease inhibitor I42 family protein n=1 Tax=Methanosarcina baikalica TaxID=3073890 RepID=A0ABU2D3N3_9EURY|nr:protease inhibitor I42 family protein [Methanosarcina sp. Z-7115]MCO5382961.1 protease inhibitor I42 family protein [Methanosarcina sp. ERenArc_MAG2]MDR7666578.1 protease inhibitor I42 family protein [Methanosarcina sp. Z-7115]